MRIRCPHCHNPMEVLEESLAGEITCPSCGSEFHLVDRQAAGTETTFESRRHVAHFELISELGRGQFGSVWMAKDLELDRTVAVKIPRRESLGPREAELFLRDARAAAQLKHPNIASVHEVGKDGETLYIVSDFIDGASLKSWLTGKRLSSREAAELVAKISRALQHAHEQGVIHRDLKPGNIVMDLTGQPHVIDFGLAKREAGEITLTADGQILGTPAYMPPEQAWGKGHEADARSDVYSLGVVLFELLTGELPFRGDAQMLLVQIKQDEPPRPRKLNAKVPRDLETITLKCLEKEPGKRYPSAMALADDLARWLDGKPITARPIGRFARAWRWTKRHPVPAALSAALSLALIAGTMVSTTYAVQAKRSAEAALRQQRRAEQLLYAAQIQRAKALWDSDQVGDAWKALESCPANLRGWEYDYLCATFNRNQKTLLRHEYPVLSVAISPDGKRIASGGYDQLIKLWDRASERELLSMKGHGRPISSVAFNAGGTLIASGSDDKTIKLWDARSGQELLTLKGHWREVKSVAFSPNGKCIASGGDDWTIKIWDAQSGREISSWDAHDTSINCLAFSPDGQRIASGCADPTIKLWEAPSGREVLSLKGHTRGVQSVAFSPDGTRIASGSDDRTIRLWDVESGQEVFSLQGHAFGVNCITFSEDGRQIASGGDDTTIKVWDLEIRQQVNSLRGHTEDVTSVAFSPKGDQVVSGSYDGTIKVWEVGFGQNPEVIWKGHADGVSCLAFSADGKRIVTGGVDGKVKLWKGDETYGEMLSLNGFTSPVTTVAFSPDGKRVVARGDEGIVRLWNGENGEEIRRVTRCDAAYFKPDGKCVTVDSYNKRIALKDMESGAEVPFRQGKEFETHYTFHLSPDGQRLALCDFSGLIRLWNAESGEETVAIRAKAGAGLNLAFSPDHRYLASGFVDGMIKVWDSTTGRETLATKPRGGHVFSVAFSPDGKRIASGNSDYSVTLWDTMSGQETLSLPGLFSVVRCVAFSPDGKRIASGNGDGMITVWDASGSAERDVQNARR